MPTLLAHKIGITRAVRIIRPPAHMRCPPAALIFALLPVT